MDAAVVVIAGDFWKADTTDSLGRFQFEGIPAGTYSFVARHTDFEATRDSIVVPRAGGLRVDAQLRHRANDGACSGYVMVEVRKPWWKLW